MTEKLLTGKLSLNKTKPKAIGNIPPTVLTTSRIRNGQKWIIEYYSISLFFIEYPLTSFEENLCYSNVTNFSTISHFTTVSGCNREVSTHFMSHYVYNDPENPNAKRRETSIIFNDLVCASPRSNLRFSNVKTKAQIKCGLTLQLNSIITVLPKYEISRL